MADAPDSETGLPPSLRLLKALVIVLTLTMIGGVITVVALIVTRMPTAFQSTPEVPATLKLPEGTAAGAVTFGKGWIAVVTTDDRILIFSDEGRLLQDVAVALPKE
jgi:Family of unknown function (DUF6476)